MFNWLLKKAGAELNYPLFLHNTLGNKLEQFESSGRKISMYNCGPTVYDFQHIGNLASAVFADTLRRLLEYNGYEVKQAINITDFGHLTSDADEGEDKMSKGLRQEALAITMENMKALADGYIKSYMDDVTALGVLVEKIEFPRASEYIDSQIAIIKTLDEKGYTYRTKDGIYFDTVLFPAYGVLGGTNTEDSDHSRVTVNPEKHNPADFALWKFNNSLGWESPWGRGFPGWHLECSAMIRSVLGERIDIHTGGIEHVSVHHNNEIAQSEAATGKHPLARFWLHRAHIQLNGHKISKSDGNAVYLKDIIEKGFHPLALRYWFLTSHYRTPANFTWEALSSSSVAFMRLHHTMHELKNAENASVPVIWHMRFWKRINDDMDTPGAIAVMWDMLKEKDLTGAQRRAALLNFDQVLGLGLSTPIEQEKKVSAENVPSDVQEMLKNREQARAEKNWDLADKIREEILSKGFEVKDTESGQVVTKSPSPLNPENVLGFAPRAFPKRAISAKPRVRMAALVLLPNPNPSQTPHASAMIFLMLPPNSTPITSVLV